MHHKIIIISGTHHDPATRPLIGQSKAMPASDWLVFAVEPGIHLFYVPTINVSFILGTIKIFY